MHSNHKQIPPLNRCIAISAQAFHCSNKAPHPQPYCTEHADECRALEKRLTEITKQTWRRRDVVRDLIAEEWERDEFVDDRYAGDEQDVRSYLESIDDQIGVMVALKTRFFSRNEGTVSMDVLKEWKWRAVVVLSDLGRPMAAEGEWDYHDDYHEYVLPHDPEEPPGYLTLHSSRDFDAYTMYTSDDSSASSEGTHPMEDPATGTVARNEGWIAGIIRAVIKALM
ncbi:hypothetical protein DICSQDRAFT_163671 [Dichomitus squalens LYAD-421 SS1]|uniref:Uncharacterized protein n=1 Tax=Dichomitus squalens (strain LYAD-421) TaxID=732165 RepID=R7SPI7_DICSQ|nr:uncharacterized protein DICSQDRAFT_163671 [Dichomitus squalens LYAD-421 SS1]EJF56892.1 hypothetical protein DICSQDRAFT_163671 [Dichomitus squalens LYAD-421 SS1]